MLWVRAETHETFIADLAALAELLALPEWHEYDQRITVEAIKRWLRTHDGWLLILDNMEDIRMVAGLLAAPSKSHVVVTTHLQATRTFAQRNDVLPMGRDESILFLLQRALTRHF